MGKLYIISGMSGSGKTTIMRSLMGKESEIVSVTTRPMREGEVDGFDYYFITEEQFNELDSSNKLAEKTTYYGSASYGVTKEEIEERMSRNDVSYIIADVEGMKQLKELYPDSVSIFLYADKNSCIEHMEKRGDGSISIAKRLLTYEEELSNKGLYDYVVRNNTGSFRETLCIIDHIIQSELKHSMMVR